MKWLRGRSSGVGLDLGSESIKVVQLKRAGGRCVIEAWGRGPVPPGTVDRGLIRDKGAIAAAIRRLLEEKGIRSRRVVTAVPASFCYIKCLVLPSLGTRELKQAANLQIKNSLPWPREDAVVDVAVYGRSPDGRETEVLAVGVKKSIVLDLNQTLQEAGLTPVVVEIQPLSAYRLLHSQCDSGGTLLVDLGASGVQFAYFAYGRLQLVRSLALGYVEYQRQPVVEDVAREIHRTLEYAQVQKVMVEPTRVVITGGGAEREGMGEKLQSLLPYWQISDALSLTGFPAISDSVALPGPSYLPALGMAWREVTV
ncbi:MAG TPA: pilus assembly protein PilM [Syntrophothermus lipocalidus]|nr:pilus assembly protein PilM [Syntrophothermus lipocalidus]